MEEIPILFIKDDEPLIEMYREYFEKKGYRSILIRNGQKGIEQAMIEGPSLVTLRASVNDELRPTKNKMPIIIITDRGEHSRFHIKPAVKTTEIFSRIKLAID
jgi:DNA-binding response OmpR family regulator